jgi:ABC-type transport system substrate-binding protein
MNEAKRLLIGAGAVLALWLPGASAGAAEMPKLLGDAQPRHGGSVVYGIESEIPALDPHITFGGSNKRVVMSVFEGLVERDRGNVDPEAKPFVRPQIVPALAESWECSTTASAIASSCARA